MKSKFVKTLPLLVATAGAPLGVVACGDGSSGDDAADGGGGEGGTQATGGNGGTTPTADPLYLVVGSSFTPDGRSTYAAVVDDIGADGSISLEEALEIPGVPSVAVPQRGGVFFVGSAEEPTVERYRVTTEGSIEADGRFSVAGLGLIAGRGSVRDAFQFISDTRAYLIDDDTLQVVIFNPQDMTTTGSFSLDGLAEDGTITQLNFVERDGNRLLVSTNHVRSDGTFAVLGKLAIIDTITDAVTYASQNRCGHLAWSAQDTAGNTYFASHPFQAAAEAGGIAGTPAAKPCMIRLLAGQDGFDPDYFVDLNALTGRPTGAVIQGTEDRAYVLAFDNQMFPITAENAEAAISLPGWAYFQIKLGDETANVTEVTSIAPGAGFGFSFTTEVGLDRTVTPFVISVAQDFSAGTFYEIAETGFVEALTAPGSPGAAFRIQ